MEPMFMILGEAAAVAADQAIEQNSSVQTIDVQRLQQRLLDRGARLHIERSLGFQPVSYTQVVKSFRIRRLAEPARSL